MIQRSQSTWLIIFIIMGIDGILLLAAISTICLYYYRLQTSWIKLRYRPLIYTVLAFDVMLILAVLSFSLNGDNNTLPNPVFYGILYGLNILAPLLIIILSIFGSYILETFSVLIPSVTAPRIRNWRLVITGFYSICMIPPTVQFYYAFQPSPRIDTPDLLKTLTAIGGSLIGIGATLIDTTLTLLLVSTVFNWTLTRKIAVASDPVNQSLYRRSVRLSIVMSISDWVAILAELYPTLFITNPDDTIMPSVLRLFAILIIICHSLILIYQFHSLTSIAVSQVKKTVNVHPDPPPVLKQRLDMGNMPSSPIAKNQKEGFQNEYHDTDLDNPTVKLPAI